MWDFSERVFVHKWDHSFRIESLLYAPLSSFLDLDSKPMKSPRGFALSLLALNEAQDKNPDKNFDLVVYEHMNITGTLLD